MIMRLRTHLLTVYLLITCSVFSTVLGNEEFRWIRGLRAQKTSQTSEVKVVIRSDTGQGQGWNHVSEMSA